jgi:hypothetical protein
LGTLRNSMACPRAGGRWRSLATRDSATEYGLRTVRHLAEGEPLATAVRPGAGRDAGDPGSRRALGEAGSAGLDAFVPGFSEAGKVARGGRRPGLHTTTIASLRYRSARDQDNKRKDASTGKTYGPVPSALGVTPQRDFPFPDSKRPIETSGSGRFVKVKALDGSTYTLDTRTGQVAVPKVRARSR